MSEWFSIGILLVAMASIQVGASVAKQLFPLIGPEAATFLRITLSALILASIWRPWRARLSLKAWGAVALYGGSLGLMNLIFYLSIERIPLGLAVALEFAGPLSVALLASRRPLDFFWAALAAGGIYLVLPTSGISADIDPWGAVLALIAGGFWALYIVFGKRAGRYVAGGNATAIGMIFAALVVVPVGVPHLDHRLNDIHVWAQALAIALMSSAIPYSLEMVALRRIPAKTFGILMSLEPALAAASGWAFLSENLSVFQWAAIGSIIVASAGTSVTSSRAP